MKIVFRELTIGKEKWPRSTLPPSSTDSLVHFSLLIDSIRVDIEFLINFFLFLCENEFFLSFDIL